MSVEINAAWFEEFFCQYLVTALWSSTDKSTPGGGEHLDRNYTVKDIVKRCIAEQKEQCLNFVTANWEALKDFDASRAGHDFWLTRNRHGAGYWDGDYPEEIGRKLTDASHQAGEVYAYTWRKRIYFQ